jgi:release factor glutamine methyltransferase
MTGGELLRQGAMALKRAGLDQPRLEAEVLLAHAWGCTREDLLIYPEREAPEAAAWQFLYLVERRAERLPTSYLTGTREFMSLEMAVTPTVLIPRPETELLVEEVLRWLASRQAPEAGRPRLAAGRPLVVDVGTGSGAIAVSLAYYNRLVQVIATDVSQAALRVAAGNARRHGVRSRVRLVAGDLLAPLPERRRAAGYGRQFGVRPGRGTAVVANLPYIPTASLEQLPSEVRHEPRLALDGGGDGLDHYRRLLPQAAAWLDAGGLLACEIGGAEQAGVLSGLLQQGGWHQVRVIGDYRGEDRVVTALRPE